MRDEFADQPEAPRALPAPVAMPLDSIWGEPQSMRPPDEDRSLDPRRILAAILRRKWLIVGLGVAGTAAGFAMGRRLPHTYAAQATLWIQVGSDNRGAQQQTGPIQAAQLLTWTSWVDLLRSFVVLDEVVKQQHTYLVQDGAPDSALYAGFGLKSEFVPGPYRLDVSREGRTFVLSTPQAEVQRGTVGDSIGPSVGFAWRPPASELRPGRTIRFRVRTPREAALDLRTNLQASLADQASFLRLELQGTDPVRTAAIVNAVADRFVAVAAELKRQKLTTLSSILREQLSSSYADLGRAERSLETFRVHTITQPTEQAAVTPGLAQTRDPVFQSFFDMRVQREQLDRDRQLIDSALAAADSGMSPVQLEAIPSVRQSAELTQALTTLTTKDAEARAMRLQFTDAHPPLRRLQAEIDQLSRQTVPTLARQLEAQLGARVRDMDSRIGSASRELQQIPTRAIEEARLRRDVAIAENLYTTLQQRYEEARLAEVSSIPDVRILDRAVPPDEPLKNRGMLLVLAGMFGGLGGAAALALLLDRFDRRVRYPEQVTLGMGLPILGSLPRLPRRGHRSGVEVEGAVVEALRSIRLNLVHAYGSAGPLVVTVTSPGSGDGKSFTSSNLAVSFADAGHRTLLIDADIRRGALHRALGVQRKPGLIDFLAGQASRDEIIQHTSVSGVEFIGCGSRKNAGPELLASATMSQFLIGLRSKYSVIIIDSAPLGAGVDPLVLGSLTGNLVLVLRTGYTDREFAMAKLEAVGRLPIRVLGVVLNDVRSEGYDYYYAYLPGYGTSEETTDEPFAPRQLPAPS